MFNFFKKQKKESLKEVNSFTEVNSNDFILPISNGLLAPNKNPGKIDPFSTTWIYLDYYIKQRIDLLRKMNDNISISHEKAQILRGGLKELKLIQSLCQGDKKDNNAALRESHSENITDYFNH